MSEKLFNLLKQAYASLGLGDTILKAYAESLAAFATDENIESLVSAQRTALEAMQKGNDKRASEAAAKVKAEQEQARAAEKAASEKMLAELKEQLEKAKAAAVQTPPAKGEPTPPAKGEPTPPKGEPTPPKEPNPMEEWEKRMAEKMDSYMKNIKTLSETVDSLKKKNEEYEASEQRRKRTEFITKTARELGVPDWREKEGFNITDAMTEDDIKNYLSEVSNNIRTAMGSANKLGIPQLDKDGNVPKEQVSGIAHKLVDRM